MDCHWLGQRRSSPSKPGVREIPGPGARCGGGSYHSDSFAINIFLCGYDMLDLQYEGNEL